jgi:hypothetical protein
VAAVVIDVWGAVATPNLNDDRRSQPGTDAQGTFDPWGDPAQETADASNPTDEDPKFNRCTADPSGESTPRDATATTAA